MQHFSLEKGLINMPNRMDTFVSKTKGAVKGVKARMDGLKGVFATLAKQHGEAAALLDAVLANPEKRKDLWPTIRTALLAHERAEVRELYPVLRSVAETRAFADHHDLEATAMEGMIEHLDAMEYGTDAWGDLFARLADTVKHHAVVEEEQQIFPIALDAIGEDRAKELDAKLVATHDLLMKQRS